MGQRRGAPVRRRRVASELRALRKKAGMTCKQVADALGVSTTKISRMETGDRGMYETDVATLLGLYKVPAKRREELLQMVRDGAERNWHRVPGNLPETWEDVIKFESEASVLTNFEPLLIPGLLQTPEYARSILMGTDDLSGAEIDMLVRTRLGRQAILGRQDAPELNVIVDEVVLRRLVGGPGVMRHQLRHLVACAERPNVSVRVVPFAVGSHPGLTGPFLILDFTNQPSLVYLEHRGNTSFLEDEKHINRARIDWRRLSMMALTQEESVRMIAEIADLMP